MSHSNSPAAVAATGVRAVIFDISGTVLDFGSLGPVAAFVEAFARHGVSVTAAEARVPMGAHKWDHIWAMMQDPSIAARWQAAHGAPPTKDDVDRIYPAFSQIQTEVLDRHSDVIPGVSAVVNELRSRGIRIANTTGFDSGMMTNLKRLAAAGGYEPDVWVTPDLVGQGRPAPWMIFHAARQLGIYPPRTIVKVGDTVADIAEAHNAGVWAVSVTRSGNEVGLSQAALAALSEDDRAARISGARARLARCGPHAIIESVADLLPVIDDISARIARGEKP